MTKTRRTRRPAERGQPAAAINSSVDIAPDPAEPASGHPAAAPIAVTEVRILALDEGIYVLNLGSIGGEPRQVSEITVPMAHVGAPASANSTAVEVVASFPGRGPWLGPQGGTLVLNAPPGGGHVLITGYAEPGQKVAALSLDLHRLDRPGTAIPGMLPALAAATAQPAVGTREIPTEIMLHIERAGDRVFPGRGWVGALGRKLRIEAFSIRPLEGLSPGDIEFKAFEGNGQETPWVTGGMLCGTRGRGLPLTGFAVRLAAHLRDSYDAIYEGSFFAAGIAGPNRNGEPCRPPVPNDPLEAVNIRLVPKAVTPAEPATADR